MESPSLQKEIFDKHYKALTEELNAMIAFKKDESEELTEKQKSRYLLICQLQNHIYGRKNAYEEAMRHDIAIIRTLDMLDVDIENPNQQ